VCVEAAGVELKQGAVERINFYDSLSFALKTQIDMQID
jgi:hypothetical protein